MTGELQHITEVITTKSCNIAPANNEYMEQPELGKRLTALRKERNLTQEELVEKSRVSVRTIQRIEAGEVMPRISTVKILLDALDESHEVFFANSIQNETILKVNSMKFKSNTVLIAAIAGAIYLMSLIILGAMDIAWLSNHLNWESWMFATYVGLNIILVISCILFTRGFIVLSKVFENKLLSIASYLLMFAVFAKGIFDVLTLQVKEVESLYLPYGVTFIIFGIIGIVFGISLFRLQDSMGKLSRIAGILEIIMGCMLITVFLFFISYVILIPAIVVEILLLYRGYEYLISEELQLNLNQKKLM